MLKRGGGQKDYRVGASLAAWTRDSLMLDQPGVRSERDVPAIHFEASEPEWGSAAFVLGDWMYAYACAGEGPCLLARVPLDAALNRSSWQYFVSNGRWSNHWRDAQPVLHGAQSGILSIHWNPFLGKFLAIYSRWLDARITVRLADHPEGPWLDAGMINADTLHSGPGWIWTTWGLGHPELALDSGQTEYVTYWRNWGTRQIYLMKIRFAKK
jgi:hypothetical protein